MSRVVPGFGPKTCPICKSNWIVASFVRGEWKRIVAPGIEVKEPVQVPVWKCGECGFIISKAFLNREVTTFSAPEVESYLVEDVDGIIHFLAHVKDHPIRPIYHAVEFESKRVVPPKPMSALVVVVKALITYNNVRCEYEFSLGAYESVITGRFETIQREVKFAREYTAMHLQDFSDLIRRVRAAGYKPAVREGVLAYFVACARTEPKFGGTVSQITGFLEASDFPEFKGVSKATVGEALSRIEALGLTADEAYGYWRLALEIEGKVAYSFIPVNHILQEKEYVIRRELPDRLFRKPDWWKILQVSVKKDAPKTVGLDRWL